LIKQTNGAIKLPFQIVGVLNRNNLFSLY